MYIVNDVVNSFISYLENAVVYRKKDSLKKALDISEEIVKVLDGKGNTFKEELDEKRINADYGDVIDAKNRYLKSIKLFEDVYEDYINNITNYFNLEKNKSQDNDIAYYFQIKENYVTNLNKLISEIFINFEDWEDELSYFAKPLLEEKQEKKLYKLNIKKYDEIYKDVTDKYTLYVNNYKDMDDHLKYEWAYKINDPQKYNLIMNKSADIMEKHYGNPKIVELTNKIRDLYGLLKEGNSNKAFENDFIYQVNQFMKLYNDFNDDYIAFKSLDNEDN